MTRVAGISTATVSRALQSPNIVSKKNSQSRVRCGF
ncbi:hypothetical protein [Ruegeria hyattellae]